MKPIAKSSSTAAATPIPMPAFAPVESIEPLLVDWLTLE
jgi:hypothetical protein